MSGGHVCSVWDGLHRKTSSVCVSCHLLLTTAPNRDESGFLFAAWCLPIISWLRKRLWLFMISGYQWTSFFTLFFAVWASWWDIPSLLRESHCIFLCLALNKPPSPALTDAKEFLLGWELPARVGREKMSTSELKKNGTVTFLGSTCQKGPSLISLMFFDINVADHSAIRARSSCEFIANSSYSPMICFWLYPINMGFVKPYQYHWWHWVSFNHQIYWLQSK